jgi:hypothetical protein
MTVQRLNALLPTYGIDEQFLTINDEELTHLTRG